LARIEDLGIVSDSEIFVRYLDLPKPDVQGMIVINKENAGEFFPAVKGLVKIGRDAIPAVLSTLKRVDESYSTRRNASRAIRLI